MSVSQGGGFHYLIGSLLAAHQMVLQEYSAAMVTAKLPGIALPPLEAATLAKGTGALNSNLTSLQGFLTGSQVTAAQMQGAIRSFTLILLEMTYVFESLLFELDSPAPAHVAMLLEVLSKPETFCSQFSAGRDAGVVKEILGEDLAETLLWRRGAICYMYSHTIVHSEGLAGRAQELSRILKAGIEEFRRLFLLRGIFRYPGESNPGEDAGSQSGSNDASHVGDLLHEQGILSSSHLLGLMYTTELHYWLWKHGHEGTPEEVRRIQRDGAKLGEVFIRSAGMVPGEAWDTSRAKELVKELRGTRN